MTHILPATLGDLQSLTELENLLFSYDRISRRQFRHLLTKANGLTVKIENDGTLAGYMVVLQRKSSRLMRIYSIGIRPETRKLGYARLLLDFAEKTAIANHCDQLTLEVCEHNDAALRLYTSVGYYRHCRKPDYYEDGCTALQLRKNLVSQDTNQ
jgi:ribosomal protein S18 acetylase RimI-like enzyme